MKDHQRTWGNCRRHHSSVRLMAVTSCLLLTLVACKRGPDQASDMSAYADAGTTAISGNAADTAAATADTAAFSVDSLPVSAAPLGAYPYLGLPDSYQEQDIAQSDFGRVPFWTGDRLQWVEGKVHAASISAVEGKPYSPLAVQKNLRTLVEQLGGRQIASGKWPPDAIKQVDDSGAGVTYVDGMGDIYNGPAETYVIHRADHDIWIHLFPGNPSSNGNWTIVESKTLQTTAKPLPADALKQALDDHGKVAIQVNFATDKAELLPDSKPQLAQVLRLLEQNPQLQLAVEGHTDNSGSAEHNLQLSQARADAVIKRLTSQGIAPARLAAKGYGQTRPIADNNTQQGRSENRRVELVRR